MVLFSVFQVHNGQQMSKNIKISQNIFKNILKETFKEIQRMNSHKFYYFIKVYCYDYAVSLLIISTVLNLLIKCYQ